MAAETLSPAPMPSAGGTEASQLYDAIIERQEAKGRILLVCEHASPHIPAAWQDLGLSGEARLAHIAWDPGALDLARALSQELDACLVHAPVSRLVYDLNRGPDQISAMPARSEVYDIPGNDAILAQERWARTRAIYLPFHNSLQAELARRLALGLRPVVVTVHSFTPIYHGKPRAVEFGVIHDADPRFAQAIVDHAPMGLQTELNAPYDAADGVTHSLRLQATPYGLTNAMLEIRNDLIATRPAATALAQRLAPCLTAALAACERTEK